MFKSTALWLRKAGSFVRNVNGTIANDRYQKSQRENSRRVNHGELSAAERGATFTEDTIYRNKKNVDTMLRYNAKAGSMERTQRLNRDFNAADEDGGALDDEQLIRIERGGGASTHAQKRIQEKIDAEELGFNLTEKDQPFRGGKRIGKGAREGYDHASSYTSAVHRELTKETPFERRERILANSSVEPSQAEFSNLMRRLAVEDEESDLVDKVQERLVEESGIYPAMRMDAFMMGDESAFPPWVHQLAPSVRDRVKYGGIGLTEDDEALRVRLSRMSLDRRRVEWERLKAAKAYSAGIKEQKVSPHDVRAARLARRQYFRLQMQRQHRANIIKRLSLHKPEAVQLIPSHHIDYSARLATIAQFVQNGVETNGQWPLNETDLQRAKIRNKQEEAERTFMKTVEEKKIIRNSKFTSSTIGRALELLDDEADGGKPYKRVSRKTYAHRVNNIVQGVEDDRGRRHQFVKQTAISTPHALSNERRELERHVGHDGLEPNIRRFQRRRERTVDDWRNREATFSNNRFEKRPLADM